MTTFTVTETKSFRPARRDPEFIILKGTVLYARIAHKCRGRKENGVRDDRFTYTRGWDYGVYLKGGAILPENGGVRTGDICLQRLAPSTAYSYGLATTHDDTEWFTLKDDSHLREPIHASDHMFYNGIMTTVGEVWAASFDL